MKQYIELSSDVFINYRFVEKIVNNKPDYIDEAKKKSNGKNVVETVTIMMPVYDNNGYHNGSYQKHELTKQDILKIAEVINEIDGKETTGSPQDDLPF